MVVSEFSRLESESLVDIEAILEGQVFHVTKRDYWPAIAKAGAILPNRDGSLRTTFGSSENSFFRNRDCVSVFDYRLPLDEKIKSFRNRCHPFRPAEPGTDGIAIAVLKSSLYSQLIPWSKWQEQGCLGQMVVPYVEAGHPGPISLDLVTQLLFLRIGEDPSSIMAAYRRTRGRSAG